MAQARSRFFVGMSLFLLSIVLVGFSRTFYLRAFFEVPPIPPHVYAHAALLTAWFVWLALQTSLVYHGRTEIHRRLGVAGAGLALAIVVMNVLTVVAIGPRLRAVFAEARIDPEFVVRAVWGDIVSVLTFCAFVALAMCWRRRPEVHKRLMLLASFSIIAPALGRIAHWPLFDHIKGLATYLSVGAMIVLLSALVIHDLVTMRRVHPATLIGGGMRIAAWFVTGSIAGSDFGRSVIHALADP